MRPTKDASARFLASASMLVALLVTVVGVVSAAAPGELVERWRQSRSWPSVLSMIQFRLQNPSTFNDATFTMDMAIADGLYRHEKKVDCCRYLKSIGKHYSNRMEEVQKVHKARCGERFSYSDDDDDDDAAGVRWKADSPGSSGYLSSYLPRLPVPDHAYGIQNVGNGLVLDVEGFSTENGGHVQQYRWLGGENQKWRFERLTGDDNGYYKIVAVQSGKCLDVSGVSLDDHAIIHQWDYVGGDNQKWEIVPTANGFMLRAKHSGRVLDVPSGSNREQVVIQQFREHGGTNQVWRIIAP